MTPQSGLWNARHACTFGMANVKAIPFDTEMLPLTRHTNDWDNDSTVLRKNKSWKHYRPYQYRRYGYSVKALLSVLVIVSNAA